MTPVDERQLVAHASQARPAIGPIRHVRHLILGRRALLAGACVLSAYLLTSPGTTHGTEETMKRETKLTSLTNPDARPVAWFEIAGKDGTRLRSFYAHLFGWKAFDVAPGADFGVTDRPTEGIGGGIGAIPDVGQGHVTFFVEVLDLEGTLREVERLGGKTISRPRTFPDMRPSSAGRGTVTFAYFADPEGHVVGLCSGIVRPNQRHP